MKVISLKNFFYIVILVSQTSFFATKILFGSKGIKYIKLHKSKIISLNLDLKSEMDRTEVLNAKIKEWQTNPFMKEKFARQKLYMSKEKEEIYIL